MLREHPKPFLASVFLAFCTLSDMGQVLYLWRKNESKKREWVNEIGRVINPRFLNLNSFVNTFIEYPYCFLSLPLTLERELKRAWLTPWKANIHTLLCLQKGNYYEAINISHLIWNIFFVDMWNCSEFQTHRRRRQRSQALFFCLRCWAVHLMVITWTFLHLSKIIRRQIKKKKLPFSQNT